MRRLPALLPIVLCFLALALGSFHLHALTDEEKRKLFLKAREEMKTVPEDSPTPTPRPKPKPAPHKSSATPKPRPRPEREDDAPPRPRRASPTPAERTRNRERQREEEAEPTPRERQRRPVPTPQLTPQSTPEPTAPPTPEPTPTATPRPSPTPAPTVASTPPSAPITVSKSGLGKEEYEEAPPAPKRSLFGWFQRDNYTYLTPAVRAAIDGVKVRRNRWRYIVVHNSGSRQGNAKIFDYYHKHVRKMPNGLAYHFVIGNGTSTGNGQIEIGGRWRKQLDGGHVHSDYLNSISLGVCLVGDFNRGQPSKEQLAACEELVRYLRKRCGKVDGKVPIVYPHKRINPPRWGTDCPGDRFPYAWFQRFPEK